MNTTLCAFTAVAAIVAAACSTDTSSSAGAIGEHSDGAATATPVSTTTGNSLGDASVPDADIDQPVTLTMNACTVGPGQEVDMCQQFANPFGRDVDLVKMDGNQSAGSHQFFLFNMTPATGRTTASPVGACPGAGLEFHPFPYFSQISGHYIVTYPEPTMGYPLAAQNGLMLDAHFINTGTDPITPTVTITVWPANPGVVTTHVGTIWLQNRTLVVPANSGATWYPASNAPVAAEDYTIITNWAHVNSYASAFQASVNGTVFYDLTSNGTNLLEPPLQTARSSPGLPMPMKAGTSIGWQCNYTGNGMFDRAFGDSYVQNAMCSYLGQYYPADASSPNYPDIIGFD